MFQNLRRSPSFCFTALLLMYFMFQIGVYFGRAWPNFPCSELRDSNVGDIMTDKVSKKEPPPSSAVTKVLLRTPPNKVLKFKPLGKPSSAIKERTGNNAIVFNENFIAENSTKREETRAIHDITKTEVIKKRGNISSTNKGAGGNTEKNLKIIVPKNENNLFDNNSGNLEIPDYIQIREADTPKFGDFTCGGTVIPQCCAHYVGDIEEAKKICYSYSNYCKGFVLSTTSSSITNVLYLMFVKTDVSRLSANFLTDFFVKSKFLKEIDWKANSNNNNRDN